MRSTPSILDGWQDQELDQILETVREVVEDPEYSTVRQWRERGGKVVGHFQVYFPEELVHAGGLLPLKICGAQVATLGVTDQLPNWAV